MTGTTLLAYFCGALLITGCSRSNNLVLGQVEAVIGSHTITVTDCYRTSVPPPQQIKGSEDGKLAYHWTPCRDADISITGEELVVNGTTYGKLNQGDVVTIDHGKVLINNHQAQVIPSK